MERRGKPPVVHDDMHADRRVRRWRVSDLFTDAVTGKMRESAVWTNAGKLVMTWGFVYVIANGGDSEFLWLTYGAIVCGHDIGNRIMNLKTQQERAKEDATARK